MYEKITGENAYQFRWRIYGASLRHGRLVGDYNLMSNLPGLFVLGSELLRSGATASAPAP